MNKLVDALIHLTSQIKKSDVKLPTSNKKSPTIHHNNQAINNGVIHEEPTNSLRSKSSFNRIKE